MNFQKDHKKLNIFPEIAVIGNACYGFNRQAKINFFSDKALSYIFLKAIKPLSEGNIK